ncbi:probable glutamate carboxypeptidase AMP1 isoform X2 [Rhodamnia argentea]|uniref:Probable glutamate carboxypeptidase AMP1 isoform X2 n=1 Tax=Rhodamnia argentea TaxID=178133 RepID=A0ABM3HLY4_9MYRT|nr:probable glutamate carboxypeptidase AMP1 isoform X2 [Rhodamnia argentea]
MNMRPTSLFPSKPTPTCTALSILALFLLASFYTLRHPHAPRNAAHFHRAFLSSASNATLAAYLRALTLRPHLAGTQPSLDAAHLVRAHFLSLGLETRVARFAPLLSYPVRASLAAHFPNGTSVDLPLTEPRLAPDAVVPYHAYSPSGSAVRALAVFANYGREEDYAALSAIGVEVAGCVAVVRRGALSRGDVVRAAESKGVLAVLMYTEGRTAWSRRGVERGTVMRGVGDPLSPGWAGVEGGEALGLEDEEVSARFPKIPSMPVSAECAEMILASLEGGRAPPEWTETLGFKVRGVGPGPTALNFSYQGEKKVVNIHNVFAVIRGLEEPDRYILLGNHRDAWTYGAVDPNSGTAALLDIARRYALMMHMGWNPRRSIILCSWDAEEFGMIGSTEWVEQNLMTLGSKAVAYLNVDCAVQGPGFFARATPQLDELLIEITKKVKDPDNKEATVYEMWAKADGGDNIQRLSGIDSDYAPFLQYAGIPSVDIYYGKAAGVWGLLALRLADDLILPFNYLSYANQLQGYVDIVINLLEGNISVHPLTLSIQALVSVAKEVELEAEKLSVERMTGELGVLRRRALNDRLMLAERGFLDADGLPYGRWFKHLVYGPSDYRSKISFFPGVAEAIWRSAGMRGGEGRAPIQHEIWRVARAIQRVADVLGGRTL